MNKLATILLCVNFITVLFPQPGYIHPDEFFQLSEIVAGDILKVDHIRSWEFNTSFPVRSVLFPYLLTGPSLSFLKWINTTGVPGLQMSAVKVIMATRLPLSFLSIFGYLATARLSDFCGVDKYTSTLLWCSSYVTWTYFTHTFSNTIEAVIMAMLLLIVLSSVSCLGHVSILKREKETLSSKNDYKDSTKEAQSTGTGHGDVNEGKDVKDERESKAVSDFGTNSDEFSDLEYLTTFQVQTTKITPFSLGLVTTAGFFNRPTFMLFAVVPMIFWFYHSQLKNISSTFTSLVFFGLGTLLASFVFIVVDTAYFNSDFSPSLLNSYNILTHSGLSFNSLLLCLRNVLSTLIITPWNFIQYNMNTENLKEHGLHPRYMHVIFNLPLLLGPLYIPLVITCLLSIVSLFKRSVGGSTYPTIMLTLMVLVPILGLSIFPHQEPRFLVPLLPIFVVLGAKVVAVMAPAKFSFIAVWVVFNLLLTLVYGYMHQAALIPALSIYQQKLSSSKSVGINYAVFYKTYPPPRHLLLTRPGDKLLDIHDLAGASVEKLTAVVKQKKSVCQESKDKCSVYVFLPATAANKVMEVLTAYTVSIASICPHLSMESPPRFEAWWRSKITFDEFLMDFCLNILNIT